MLSDTLADVHIELIDQAHHYADDLYDYDPIVFDEIQDITNRIDQLRSKLDSITFQPTAPNSWRYNPSYKNP